MRGFDGASVRVDEFSNAIGDLFVNLLHVGCGGGREGEEDSKRTQQLGEGKGRRVGGGKEGEGGGGEGEGGRRGREGEERGGREEGEGEERGGREEEGKLCNHSFDLECMSKKVAS